MRDLHKPAQPTWTGRLYRRETYTSQHNPPGQVVFTDERPTQASTTHLDRSSLQMRDLHKPAQPTWTGRLCRRETYTNQHNPPGQVVFADERPTQTSTTHLDRSSLQTRDLHKPAQPTWTGRLYRRETYTSQHNPPGQVVFTDERPTQASTTHLDRSSLQMRDLHKPAQPTWTGRLYRRDTYTSQHNPPGQVVFTDERPTQASTTHLDRSSLQMRDLHKPAQPTWTGRLYRRETYTNQHNPPGQVVFTDERPTQASTTHLDRSSLQTRDLHKPAQPTWTGRLYRRETYTSQHNPPGQVVFTDERPTQASTTHLDRSSLQTRDLHKPAQPTWTGRLYRRETYTSQHNPPGQVVFTDERPTQTSTTHLDRSSLQMRDLHKPAQPTWTGRLYRRETYTSQHNPPGQVVFTDERPTQASTTHLDRSSLQTRDLHKPAQPTWTGRLYR